MDKQSLFDKLKASRGEESPDTRLFEKIAAKGDR